MTNKGLRTIEKLNNELYLVVCCFDNLFSIIIYVAAEDTFK